jgi:hypothetical protein
LPHHHLGIYLNDHLAGSAGALELLAVLGNAEGLDQWAANLRAEIAADRDELEELMRHATIAPNTMRQAAAWVSAKLAQLKTRADDPGGGLLRRLELIEVLALGIDGKRALWAALQVAAEHETVLRGVNYPRLIARADDQRRTVEAQRLQVAARALSSQS